VRHRRRGTGRSNETDDRVERCTGAETLGEFRWPRQREAIAGTVDIEDISHHLDEPVRAIRRVDRTSVTDLAADAGLVDLRAGLHVAGYAGGRSDRVDAEIAAAVRHVIGLRERIGQL